MRSLQVGQDSLQVSLENPAAARTRASRFDVRSDFIFLDFAVGMLVIFYGLIRKMVRNNRINRFMGDDHGGQRTCQNFGEAPVYPPGELLPDSPPGGVTSCQPASFSRASPASDFDFVPAKPIPIAVRDFGETCSERWATDQYAARSERPPEAGWSRRHRQYVRRAAAFYRRPACAKRRIGLADKNAGISGCACRITYNAGM